MRDIVRKLLNPLAFIQTDAQHPRIDENFKETSIYRNVHYFIKWSIISILIGTSVGSVGAIFARAIEFATTFWMGHSYALFLLPICGLIIVFLYHFAGADVPRGTNLVLSSISTGEEITSKMAPLIFVSSVLTHLGSGSAGREGAALQIGGSLGNLFARIFKLNQLDRNIVVMCGMSACFSALFGTPLSAGIFSMEIFSVGVMYYAALIPCLFSAYIAAAVAPFWGVAPERFVVESLPNWDIKTVLLLIVLSAATAIVSIAFCVMMHGAEHQYHKIKKTSVRILVAALLFIGVTLLIGTRDYCGGGFPLIERCMEGKVRPEAFFMKMLMTSIVIGGGFKGGEIVPTFTIGATFGCFFGTLIGLPPQISTACGMVACFVGVTNCPIASLIMGLELCGGSGLAFYAIAVAVSFTLSGYYGLYSAQKFAYSKTIPMYINAEAEKIRQNRKKKSVK